MDWMVSEMKSRMRATAPLRNNQHWPKGTVNHLSAEERDEPKVKCWICLSSDHWVDQCHKFTALNPSDCLKTVKDNQACFSCLKRAGKDHRASNCSGKRPCTEMVNSKPCGKNHHPLLHQGFSTIGVASVIGQGDALLPVVSPIILGKNNHRESCNILLDSGAQISLIRTDLAEKFKLKGKGIKITMTKVGEEEELETKIYQVAIRSLENNAILTIQVCGIAQISDDINQVETKGMVERFGLRDNLIHRGNGPLDLLIGVDHARMHTGEVRQVGNLITRHSPLGWLVFGNKSNSHIGTNKVLRVIISK